MATDAAGQSARARDEAVRFLAARARTVSQMRRHLLRRGVAAELAEQVIADLARQRLLDDAAYARDWIAWRLRTRPAGSARLAAELATRGVAPELVTEALASFAGQLDAAEAAAQLLRRERWRYAAVDRDAARRRMLGFLARRGFAQETAWKAVDLVWEEWQGHEGE